MSMLFGAASQAGTSHSRFVADWRLPANLVGVWNITSKPVDCASGQLLPVPPIVGIIAFHAGGTSTEAAPTAAPRTPGLGTWSRTGFSSFAATAHVMNYDINGFSTGSLVVRREITVARDGGSFSATGRTTITDISGNQVQRCTVNEALRADD
jgi:hypothetical protein